MDCNSNSFLPLSWRGRVSWVVTRYIIFHALFYRFGEGRGWLIIKIWMLVVLGMIEPLWAWR